MTDENLKDLGDRYGIPRGGAPYPEDVIAARVAAYRKIEALRKRPLIVYATSTRANVSALMAPDAVREFIDQVDMIKDGDAVDVLIHSHGGDGLTAWKLMAVLRERFKTVGVLVPFAAFSAATIFALGADEILMHPHASLGPIDPQIRTVSSDGKARQFAYEDLGGFLRFLREEMGITEQAHFVGVFDKLFSTVDPLGVGAARRASDLASEVGARMLRMHTKDEQRCKQIAQNLNKTFFAHGDAVSRTRAKKLELKIGASDQDLEALMWEVHALLETLMQLREPFSPLTLVLRDPAAAAQITPRAPMLLPANMPQPIAMQAWQQAAQAAYAATQGQAAQVSYRVVGAIVESARIASAFEQSGTISGIRLPDGNLQLLQTDNGVAWRRVTIDEKSNDG